MIDPAPYNAARQILLQHLSRMHRDLAEYAKRPNVNAKAVEIRKKQIEDMAAAVDGMDAAVEGLLQASLDSERRAYQNGLAKAARPDRVTRTDTPRRYDIIDKETIRANSLQAARDKWENLW